jgi:hypothetical protein
LLQIIYIKKKIEIKIEIKTEIKTGTGIENKIEIETTGRGIALRALRTIEINGAKLSEYLLHWLREEATSSAALATPREQS